MGKYDEVLKVIDQYWTFYKTHKEMCDSDN